MCIYLFWYYIIPLLELQKVSTEYEEKQRSRTTPERVMFSLISDIEDLKRLNEEGRKLRTEVSTALDILILPEAAQRDYNVRRKLGGVRSKLRELLRGLYRFKRTPASHVFVFMVSSALRDRKPYALPVQCIPYAS